MNDIKIGKVAAVVVTFNRIELLKKVINGLRNQTKKIDQIIVVNNSSIDGTLEWLNIQDDIITVTQGNLGSSGGQFTGAKTAFEMGFEWIWQMDDDVVADSDCLDNLLLHCDKNLVCVPLRITYQGDIFYNDIKKINLTNPLKGIWRAIVDENDFQNEIIPVEGFTFEGPIFHRSIFEKIGFADKNFFIYADDTEYSIRVLKQKIKSAIVKNAVLRRQLPLPENPYIFDWKTYYVVRNLIAIDVLHGNFAVRWLRPFGYFLTWLFRCKNFADIKTVLRAFKDGYFYQLLARYFY
jgi:GT2 family glycosyltransferase